MGQTKENESYPRVHKDKENIFAIVEMKKNNFRIALGNEIVVDKVFRTKQEAQEHIDKKYWEMLLNVSCVVMKKVYEQLKQQDNEQTKQN